MHKSHTNYDPDATTPFDLPKLNPPLSLEGEDIYHWIAEAAYFRAEKRGFESGYEMIDWADAEEEYLNLRQDQENA